MWGNLLKLIANQVRMKSMFLMFQASSNGDKLSDYTGIAIDSIQELQDEFAMLEEDRLVTIASKMKEDISRAPSIVTIITAELAGEGAAPVIREIHPYNRV